MSKSSRFKKFFDWFFEEEKDENKTEEEYIEISPWQMIIILVISFIFIIYLFSPYFYSHIKEFFKRPPSPDMEKIIDKNIEKNYFEKGNSFVNGDFTSGFDHWVTSDGGKIFRSSKHKAFLNNKDFHSPPYSLHIESISVSNRYYYTKMARRGIIDNPYSHNSYDTWLGVLPNSTVTMSLWYKGDTLALYLNYLTKKGECKGLGKISGSATEIWEKLQIEKKVPLDGRAIGIEMTLNRALNMPPPVVLIDDVNIKVK